MAEGDDFGLVGQVLDGQFRVDTFVGEGDLSVVYKGHHFGLDAPVAIKLLNLPSTLEPMLVKSFVQGFRDGSHVHYRLSQGSLHIARSISSGTARVPRTGAEVPYLVREWLEGRSLAVDFATRRAEGQAGRPLAEVLALFESAAAALAYAHGQGVVHTRINPGNLFLTETPKGPVTKVLDFGVARAMREGTQFSGSHTRPSSELNIFYPAYAAPEQFEKSIGPVGAWTDVYTLALIVLEALRDRPAMAVRATVDCAAMVLDRGNRPTPRALGLELNPAVDAVLTQAVALEPSLRPQDASEFWDALSQAAAEDAGKPVTVSTRQGPTVVPSQKVTRRELVPDALLKRARPGPPPPRPENPRASRPSPQEMLPTVPAPVPAREVLQRPQTLAGIAPPAPPPRRTPPTAIPVQATPPPAPVRPPPSSSRVPVLVVPEPEEATLDDALVPELVAEPYEPNTATTLARPAPQPQTLPLMQQSMHAMSTTQQMPPMRRSMISNHFWTPEEPPPAANGAAQGPASGPGPRPVPFAPPPAMLSGGPALLPPYAVPPVVMPPQPAPAHPSRMLLFGLLAAGGLLFLTVVVAGVVWFMMSEGRSSDASPAPAASTASAARMADPPSENIPAAQARDQPAPSPTFAPEPEPIAAAAAPPPAAATGPFDRKAARSTLDAIGKELGVCARPGGKTGKGLVRLTFAPDGSVMTSNVIGSFARTPEGDCVAVQVRHARVAPFRGAATSMIYEFTVKR